MQELRHHLLCPMECRANIDTINECQRIYCSDPNQESHAIVTEDGYGDYVILPFFLNGMTSHLNFNILTRDYFETHNLPRLSLTHRDLTWDLSTTIYEDHENAMLNYKIDIVRPVTLCVCLLNLCVCQPVKTLQTHYLTKIL